MSGIRKEDLVDADVVDAVELASDGSSAFNYRTGIAVTSTTSGTKRVVVSGGLILNLDLPLQVKDKVIITGTSGGSGDGIFTVSSIVNDTTFDLVEAIGTSTGGVVDFRHPSGATKVGVDPTGIINFSAATLQAALAQMDSAVTGQAAAHKTLRQLIHLADSPGDGFGATLNLVSTPVNDPFPTQHVWYTNPPTNTLKLVQIDVTYNANKTVNTAQYTLYDIDGTTVLFPRLLDTLDYTNFLTPKVVRTFPMV